MNIELTDEQMKAFREGRLRLEGQIEADKPLVVQPSIFSLIEKATITYPDGTTQDLNVEPDGMLRTTYTTLKDDDDLLRLIASDPEMMARIRELYIENTKNGLKK